MATRRTPPLYTRGRYQLRSPFQADPTRVYVCTAIRSFTDLEQRDIDVFKAFYEPKNLTENDYSTDKSAKAAIITLESNEGALIYVPDTYIDAFPNMGAVEYSHMVLSVDLGALPDYLSLDHTKNQVANKVSDIIGVSPEVHVHTAPSTDVVTPSEHETAEANRLAAIENRETDYARALRLEQELTDANNRIETLEQILKDNNLL